MNKIERRTIVSVLFTESSFDKSFFKESSTSTNCSKFLGIKSGYCSLSSLTNGVSSKFLEFLLEDAELSKTEMFSRLVLVSRSTLGVGEGDPISVSRAETVTSSCTKSQVSWYGLKMSS